MAPYAATLNTVEALLKSAQFPTHGWLLEVMETPTPVWGCCMRALLMLRVSMVRFADVMVLSASSLHFIAIVGGFTALIDAIAMCQDQSQVSLRVTADYSDGFMPTAIGLGASRSSVLHIGTRSPYTKPMPFGLREVLSTAHALRRGPDGAV